jgi:hypothetical protein
MRARKTSLGLAAVLAAGLLLLVLPGSQAATTSTATTGTTSTTGATSTTGTTSSTKAESEKWVGVAQTVLASTTNTGSVSGKPLVFTQFSANGSGPATLQVPMSHSGFRNLSSLGTPPIHDGYAVWKLQLSGPTAQRAVADFPTAQLPVQVSAAYELNGKKMKANQIVGKSGLLKVTYVITNPTTKDTKVTFKNVLGDEETTTVKAPIPVAAVVDVTIPAAFTNVDAPGAGTTGNGNGTSTASWTLLLFDPLGGVKQSVTYQAHVTNAVVPSATVEAEVLPPSNVPPLPSIKEPGAPAVPTVTLGRRLAALQARLQPKLRELAAKAQNVLTQLKQVAVKAAEEVSGKAATLAGNLPAVSAAADTVSINAGDAATALASAATQAADHSTRAADISSGLTQAAGEAADASHRAADISSALAQAAVDAADHAQQVGDALTRLEALPDPVKLTPAYRTLHATLTLLHLHLIAHAARLAVAAASAKALQIRLIGHAARLTVTSVKARALAALLVAYSSLETRLSLVTANVLAPAAAKASTQVSGLIPTVNDLSSSAGQAATNLASATSSPSQKSAKAIGTKQVGGGAKLDSAVGQLDSAINDAANKVDADYAYLTALDKRAAENRLPAGNAKGATAQAGAYVLSVSGANNTAHQVHIAAFIGGFALVLGIGFGIALYRMRRGLPTSLAPPKASPAKG